MHYSLKVYLFLYSEISESCRLGEGRRMNKKSRATALWLKLFINRKLCSNPEINLNFGKMEIVKLGYKKHDSKKSQILLLLTHYSYLKTLKLK